MGYVLLTALLAGLDLLLKAWSERQDEKTLPRPLAHTGGLIRLECHRNPGLPFGFLRECAAAVRLIPLAVAGVYAALFALLAVRGGSGARRLSLSLILAGAISNLYDRFTKKYVVDYFSIRLGPLKKVVFNLGDWMIFIGSAMLVILEGQRGG